MTPPQTLSAARFADVGAMLNGCVERGEVAGFVGLVARGNDVHVSVGGVQDLASGVSMRRNTLFRVLSMTKPVIAAAAMILVEETRIRLDDPVERWLPELANRRVLRSLDSPVSDTVPAVRPVTLRDLLTLRAGLGVVMPPPETHPIQVAMAELGLAPGPDLLPFSPDEFMERIGRLPLIHQPGEQWLYHTAIDIAAVLIARVAGMPLEDFLRERIFAPLGMRDTTFSVPEGAIGRFATAYACDRQGRLVVWDAARGGRYAQPPVFPSEVVSTADDYLAFARMLLNRGRRPGGRILSRAAVQLMMTDQLTAGQKAASPFSPGFWDNKGWGFGGAVITKRDAIAASPGSYGWTGGLGTAFTVDPVEDMVAILLIQRLMTRADDTAIAQDFFTLAYRAIDD